MGPDGCKALPAPNGFNGSNACDYDQAFVLNSNGTVALWNMLTIHDNAKVFVHNCMQIDAKDGSVGMGSCQQAHPIKPDPTKPSQKWVFVSNSDGSVTIKQGGMCLDNNYKESSLSWRMVGRGSLVLEPLHISWKGNGCV